MDTYVQRFLRGALFGLSAVAVLASTAGAAPPTSLQGPADINRVRPEDRLPTYIPKEETPLIEQAPSAPTAPPIQAGQSTFTLKTIQLEGATAFAPEALAAIYTPYVGQKITLEIAQHLAERITEYYRAAGYFLSLGSVMEANQHSGLVRIKITEGYVGVVELSAAGAEHRVVQQYINRLKEQKPISSAALESFLLRLNDLPGLAFRSVLAPAKLDDEAAVKLVLIPTQKEGRGSISFDNYGSRFLGPNEAAASYSASLFPLAQTSVSLLTSLPMDELSSANLDQSLVVAPDVTVGLSASYTKARPGFTLEVFDIESDSVSLGMFLKYQAIRQRDHNLSFKLALDGRHSTTDLLATPFLRDDIRVARLSTAFDATDSWHGISTANLTLSQGLNMLGASGAGERNLSRAEARPDFNKAELSLARLQALSTNWSVLVSASGQAASGPLYSSEEFGYGGQAFGRAYDASEITGDHGINGSVELRYSGYSSAAPIGAEPYVFYDSGIVWNDDVAQRPKEMASSAGAGVRFTTASNLAGTVSLAWPLTREIVSPVYGEGAKGPRILLQLSQGF